MAKKQNGPKCPKCNKAELIFRELKDGNSTTRPVLQCPECKYFAEVIVDAKDDKFQVELKSGGLTCPICNNPLLDSRSSVCMPGFRKGCDWLHIVCVFSVNTAEKRQEFAAAVLHHNWLMAMQTLIKQGVQKPEDVPNLKPWYLLDEKSKQDSMNFVGAIEEAFGNFYQGFRLATQSIEQSKGPKDKSAAV